MILVNQSLLMERTMTPSEFRKIRALDRASLYARQARAMLRDAYASDPDIDRRHKLDEVMVSLQEYEDTITGAVNEAYEQLAADQPST